ncbi:MAG: hypothetical protein ABI564_12985 [Ideonella sp.]
MDRPSILQIRPVGRSTPRQAQRGSSLIEALVGFLIVAVGMLGSAQWQLRLRQAVDLARQQSEATRIAQTELEALRAFASSQVTPGLASFAEIASGQSMQGTTSGANTSYRLTRQVRDSLGSMVKELVVDVDWADRSGVQRSIRLFGVIGGQAPVLILPLGHRASIGRADALLGRHATIPRDAHDLGNGQSAFKPVTEGDQAWLFDNRSGHIVARCSGIPIAKANRQLLSADLTSCSAADNVLLSGRVRFALPSAPAIADPAAARDTPQALTVTLDLSSTGHAQMPACLGEAIRMVDIGSPSSPRPIAVAIGATPASQGLAAWTELGDRYWRYHCAVALAAGAPVNGNPGPPQWSGRLRMTPTGWQLGHISGTLQLCRYSADTDASGQIDRGAEAPDSHADIEDALVEQNYLAIAGEQPCPAAGASHTAADSLPWFSGNAATVPHQP